MTTTRGPATVTRQPIRAGTDADFGDRQLRHLACGATTAPVIGSAVAHAALRHRAWLLPCLDADARAVTAAADVPGDGQIEPVDEQVLHAFETAVALRPPVDVGTATLSPAAADAWLTIALRWLTVARSAGDLRYLNAACKILGAVWHHLGTSTNPGWGRPELRRLLAQVAAGITAHSDNIVLDRAARPTIHAGAPARAMPAVPPHGSDRCTRIVVLAGAGSSSADRFTTAARARDIPIAGSCWYGPPTTPAAVPSHYADAWYPHPGAPTSAAPDKTPSPGDRTPAATPAPDWDAATTRLRGLRPDVIVLIGMPIVPPAVLDLARLGVINAHNGALPAYRGMDAVGWAMINGDAITCTVHHATPRVDAGAVFATIRVARSPLPTLRQRVKAAQLHLLLDVAGHSAATGVLPPAVCQTGAGRLHYRLHPHLKRLLDHLWSGSAAPAASPNTIATM